MTSWLNKYPNEVIKYHSDDPKASFSSGGWDVLPKNIKFDFSGFRKIKEIFLTNKERAYLVPIVLDNRGRNAEHQIALVLPDEQKVIPLLDTIIQSVDDVYDLNSDHISEVITSAYASGQGAEESINAIVHITKNGTIHILHMVDTKNNSGAHDKDSSKYFEKNITWELSDGNKILKETTIISKGRDKKSPNVTTTVKFYQLTNNGFELQKKEKNNLVK
ncbi:MAG: hypothetical protein QMB67_02825 [Sulfurospirillum sp.]